MFHIMVLTEVPIFELSHSNVAFACVTSQKQSNPVLTAFINYPWNVFQQFAEDQLEQNFNCCVGFEEYFKCMKWNI